MAAFVYTLVACGPEESKKDTEQAFTEYRDFVAETEADAATELSEIELRAMRKSVMDTSLWQTETAELQQQYEAREKSVRDNFESYDEARKKEIEELDTRYNAALQKREQRYKEVSRRYRLREDLLGMPVSADDMSGITASELPNVYTRFVEKLEALAVELNAKEWDLVKGWWAALENRKSELQSELTPDSKKSIQQAAEKYLNIRKNFAAAT